MSKVTVLLAGETPSEIRLVLSAGLENSNNEREERFRILAKGIQISVRDNTSPQHKTFSSTVTPTTPSPVAHYLCTIVN